MKPRTIVYGLGKRFQQYFYEIHDTYNVVGYCDANPDKVAMFRNGIAKEKLAERQNESEQILITLGNGRVRFSVAVEMINRYRIDAGRIVFFDLPTEAPALRTRKDTLYHPEMIFWGQSNEDAVIYLLSYQMHLELGTLTYFESGLRDLRVGSVTYGLYKHGAKGILSIEPYENLHDEIKIFRSEDMVVDIQENIQETLNAYEKIDVIVLHDEKSLKILLKENRLFKFKPLIIIMDNIVQDTIYYIRMQGYIWHSTLSAMSTVFCRSDIYLSETI